MPNSKSDAGLVRTSASFAHAFLRDQMLAILAPVYLFQHRRASTVSAREIADACACGPTSAIELHGIGRS